MANLLKALPEACRSDFQTFEEVFMGKNLKTHYWNEYVFAPPFQPETIRYAMEHHEPKENEILMVSFEKTGTTWVREIVRQLLYGNDEKLDLITRDLDPATIYLEAGNCKKYNVLHNLPIPRTYYSTHLPAELVNMEKYKSRKMKFIYTIRNPKDRLVSLFHFLPNFPFYHEQSPYDTKDWNAFFDVQVHGKCPNCWKKGEGYMEHILGWLPHIKGNKNALMMVYEDMVKNPQKEIKRIADFIEVKKSDEEILDVCRKTSFDTMSKADRASESYNFNQINLKKGKIGNWKNYFTPEQSAFIDDEVEKKLKGTGISFTYE